MPPSQPPTDAIVVRRVHFGDADVIVTLLTREHGKCSALARSARRSKRRFGAALELFTVSAVELRRRGNAELWTLTAAQTKLSYQALAMDMATLAHASYATELVRELTAPEVSDPAIFDLLVEMFAVLKGQGATTSALRCFELALLEHVGLRPIFDRCAACGRDPAEHGDAQMVSDPGRGGVVCGLCAPLSRGAGVRPISRLAQVGLVELQAHQSLAAAAAAGPASSEARDVLLSMILYHVGKPLKSVEFITKMSAASPISLRLPRAE